MTLSAYEQQEWDKLQKRKAASLSKEARKILRSRPGTDSLRSARR